MLKIGEKFEFASIGFEYKVAFYVFLEVIGIEIELVEEKKIVQSTAIKCLAENGGFAIGKIKNRKLLEAIGIKTFKLSEENRTPWFYCPNCACYHDKDIIINSDKLRFNSVGQPFHSCGAKAIQYGFFVEQDIVPTNHMKFVRDRNTHYDFMANYEFVGLS